VRTNSRGEAIVRVRGSEERQTQVFLEGAPLAVPWDGRVDLGVLPAALFGEVRVVKGAAPIEYGPNAAGGIVNMRAVSGADAPLRAIVRSGAHGQRELAATGGGALGGAWSVLAGAGGLWRDAVPDASGPGGRLNTDLDSRTVYAGLQYGEEARAARMLLFRNQASRGIAPETDDAAPGSPRFWRYPDIRLTQLIAAAATRLPRGASLQVTGWRQWFGQRIDQYADSRYDARTASQRDRDDTIGGRLAVSAPLDRLTLRLTATAQTSRHAQADTVFPPGAPGPELRYRQSLLGLGAELEAPLGGADATVGIAFDRAATPLTGDKPARRPFDALGFSAALRLPIADDLRLVLAGGRRTRFPTARELFGEALGRFLLNPDLRPEIVWLADAELGWTTSRIRLTVNPFAARSRDTLSQRTVAVGSASLRQRFNLSGSWSYGIDAELVARLGNGFSAELGAGVLRARATGSGPRRLVQRPSHDLGAALVYRRSPNLSLRGEVRLIGPAVDLAAGGGLVRLEGAAQVDLQAERRLSAIGGGRSLFLSGAVDNLNDAAISPQLGLPLPGRMVRVGLRIE